MVILEMLGSQCFALGWRKVKKLTITRTSASTTKSNNFTSVSLKSKVPIHDCDAYPEKKKGITSNSTTNFNEGILFENDIISEL